MNYTRRARALFLLAAIASGAAACGQASPENGPAVAVSVVDDGDGATTTDASNGGAAESDPSTTPAAGADSGGDERAASGEAPAGSPGSACRGAGFDFEPWLSICSEAQTFRAEPLAENPLDDVALTIPIQPGDRIADGVPAEGAGFLGESNDTIAYTFELDAGEAVYVVPETGGWSQGCSIGPPDKAVMFQVFAPNGTALGAVQDNNNCNRAAFAVPAVEAGTYTLLVGSWVDTVMSTQGITTYAFTVSPAQFDRFTTSVGATLAPGSPEAGAGHIETDGSADVYTVPLAAGDEVIVNRLGFDGSCSIGPGPGLELTITAPSGEILLDREYLTNNCAYEWTEPTIVAAADGDFVVAVSGTSWHSTDRAVEYQIELAPYQG